MTAHPGQGTKHQQKSSSHSRRVSPKCADYVDIGRHRPKVTVQSLYCYNPLNEFQVSRNSRVIV